MLQPRFGYDIEYGVRNLATGTLVPAGVLPIFGVKGYPEPVRVGDTELGGVEIDCCAAEITPPPADNEDQFVNNIQQLIAAVRAKYQGHSFEAIASHTFGKNELNLHPASKQMGCSPDFNAWTNRVNGRPRPQGGFRTFGGHVHIETGTPLTVRAMDLTAGMFSVLHDPDTKRRALYGKAGAFRPKPYGVEYRVLSNFWCDNEALTRQIYRLTKKALEMPEARVMSIVKAFGGSQAIQKIINTSDKESAKAVFKQATRD